MKRLLCVFGWHDYRWVGFQWTHDTPNTAWGHDHECARCGDKICLGYDRGLARPEGADS